MDSIGAACTELHFLKHCVWVCCVSVFIFYTKIKHSTWDGAHTEKICQSASGWFFFTFFSLACFAPEGRKKILTKPNIHSNSTRQMNQAANIYTYTNLSIEWESELFLFTFCFLCTHSTWAPLYLLSLSLSLSCGSFSICCVKKTFRCLIGKCLALPLAPSSGSKWLLKSRVTCWFVTGRIECSPVESQQLKSFLLLLLQQTHTHTINETCRLNVDS